MESEATFRVLANRLKALADADADLSQGAKLLLDKIKMLAEWAHGRTGLCFPGYERLAQLVGRSVRMIGHYLRELRERGYLSWSRRQRCPNVYFLNFDRVSADPPVAPSKFPLAVKGYPFAGGRYSLPGVRELLRGAAAARAACARPAAVIRSPEPERVSSALEGSLAAFAALVKARGA